MAKSDAERMRDYRARKRSKKFLCGKLRPVGRPENKLPTPSAKQCMVIAGIMYSVWYDLQQAGVKDISFRSLRHRASYYRNKPLTVDEVRWGIQSQTGSDCFYCEGKSLAKLPLKITVVDRV